MHPRLIAIAGELNGRVFEIGGAEVTVGREPYHRVAVRDPAVSRSHCVLKDDSGRVTIFDLDSLNGTFVNDVPVKERDLRHGDQIRVGTSMFLYLSEDTEPAPLTGAVQLDEDTLATSPTVSLRREDALYLQPEKLAGAPPSSERLAQDLGVLMKLSTAINSTRDLAEIQRTVLELSFEALPADAGALLMDGEEDGEFSSVFSMERASGPGGAVRVSRTVVRRVLQEGVAVLTNNLLDLDPRREADSLFTGGTRSLLAVPLSAAGRVTGVLYFTAGPGHPPFDEDHLQLMTAVSAVAAAAIENSRGVRWLIDENERLRDDIDIEHTMVGESAEMRDVYQTIARVAPTDSTVLISGESGTGKELAARAIHGNSRRSGKPFIAINCAALTETLLESELFGHEKGAFTGAVSQKKGKLEMAEGGTVFLDEIGELALPLQVKLLRTLQEREFERVGGTRPISIDVRILAATNKDLEQCVREGSFRKDLFYRINVITLAMPPLRRRRGDVMLLARYFAARYSEKCRRRITGISPAAAGRMNSYDWPGNVRELQNAVERAVVLGAADVLLPEDLPEALLEAEVSPEPSLPKFYEAVKEAKRQIILKAFRQCNGNHGEAARLLGIHPNNLYRLIRNLDLSGVGS